MKRLKKKKEALDRIDRITRIRPGEREDEIFSAAPDERLKGVPRRSRMSSLAGRVPASERVLIPEILSIMFKSIFFL
jgi:hypothetical protein